MPNLPKEKRKPIYAKRASYNESVGGKTGAYSALVILILLIIKVVCQWYKKSLTYAYGFSVDPSTPNAEFFEISKQFP